jgi:hypothetical protein
MLITVIGRGHGGTRAMSHTLSASGVDMGAPLNESGDLLPPDDMYEACRVPGAHLTDDLADFGVPYEHTFPCFADDEFYDLKGVMQAAATVAP